MLKELLKPEIKELIAKRQWNNLKDVLVTWPAPEIADLLLDIDKTDRVFIFRSLPRDISADIFAYLEHEQRDSLLHDMTDHETRHLLEDLPPDDRTELLEELPAKVTRRMLNLLSPEDLIEARQLLGYPEDSIGRQMTPDFVAVRPDWSIGKALSHIKQFGKDSETIYRIYVTDKDGKLLDDILLRSFIIANENKPVSSLMDYNVTSISAFDDQEEAVRKMEKYDLFAIPVVDSVGMLVGIVTFDDVLDISEEEATEDIQKLSAINPVEQSYLSASIQKLWIKRLPWLLTLLLTSIVTAYAMQTYNELIQKVALLSNFIPLLIGTAGNSGAQSATLIIRALSLEEVTFANWFKILMKELRVGLLLAGVLGLLTFVVGFIISSYDPVLISFSGQIYFSMTVSLSIFTMIILANLVGSMLPLVLSKMKLDPAVISNPLISTLADVSGILIYFTVAMWLLGEIMDKL